MDISRKLNYDEITDVLLSFESRSQDPMLPKFRDWLVHLGAGEYILGFLRAGYDLKFIAQHGLSESDIDCVGVSKNKMGIRRKLIALHDLTLFYNKEEEEEEEEDEEEDEEEEEEDEEEEEEED